MSVLVRCRRTGQYLAGDGWTNDPQRARSFANGVDALGACIEREIYDVEMVLRAPGSGVDGAVLPLR